MAKLVYAAGSAEELAYALLKAATAINVK